MFKCAGSGLVIGSITLTWEGKCFTKQQRLLGEKLLREKAVALLGNPETRRLVVMQGDYYWLEVTSCCPPLEAHHCAVCEGCCVELGPGEVQFTEKK